MVTEYLQGLNLENLRRMLEGLLANKVPPEFDPSWEDRANFRHEILRWCVSASGGVSIQWEALEQSGGVKGCSREDYVLALWSHLTTEENEEWRDLIENRLGTWTIYQGALFSWFLSRFNLPAARAIKRAHAEPAWRDKFLGPGAGLAFGTASALVLAGSLYWQRELAAWTALFGALACGAVLLFGWRLSKVDWRSFVQMLLPRLGATVGIGYLTLALAPDLVRRIFRTGTGSAAWFPFALASALTLGCYLFTLLHVDRRVAPQLGSRPLHRRSLTVVALGIGHTATGLALLGPLLFNSSFLGLSSVHPCAGQLVLTAAVALSLGVALQLVWEEKSLTEPL